MTERPYKIVKDPWGYQWAVRPESHFKNVTQDLLGPKIDRELGTLKYLRDHAQLDQTFIDVGAHVGYYAIRLARHFNLVYAIEPNPFNYYGLILNLRLNKIWNVLPLNIGASDKEGARPLYCAGGGSTFFKRAEYIKRELVQCFRLDQILKDAMAMKIDTEGHEVQVLQGSQALLENLTVVVVENHTASYGAHAGPDYWNQVQALLQGFNSHKLEGHRYVFERREKVSL